MGEQLTEEEGDCGGDDVRLRRCCVDEDRRRKRNFINNLVQGGFHGQ
jgi:hypothetical protein